jgi:hypothetical protein
MGYTLAQARAYAEAVGREEAAHARLMLIVQRGAQADEKGYGKVLEVLGGERKP